MNVTHLWSFVGLVNYYGNFLPNLSIVLAPLVHLAIERCPKEMGSSERKALSTVKSQLYSQCLLVHFDPQKPLTLACDGSPYGV